MSGAGLERLAYRRFGFLPPFLANAAARAGARGDAGTRASARAGLAVPALPRDAPLQVTVSPRRERLLLAAAVVALTLVGALYSFSGVNTRDEAWFLQVVTRVVGRGHSLPRRFLRLDPALGVAGVASRGPLRRAVAWVKLLAVAVLAATLGLVVWVVRGLGAGPGAPSSSLPPCSSSHRRTGGASTSRWRRVPRRLPRRGARLGARRPTGVGVGVRRAERRRGSPSRLEAERRHLRARGAPRHLLASGGGARSTSRRRPALAGFAVAAVLPIVPVAATGGFDAFVDYGFRNKGAYPDLGAVGTWTAFGWRRWTSVNCSPAGR